MKKFRAKINITTRLVTRAFGHTYPRQFLILLYLLSAIAVLPACRNTARAKEHVAQGNRYFEQKRSAEAENEYQQAIQINPDFAEAHYRLGLLQIEEEHPSAAIKSLSRAVDLDRKNRDARLQLGNLLVSATQYAEARQQAWQMLEEFGVDAAFEHRLRVEDRLG